MENGSEKGAPFAIDYESIQNFLNQFSGVKTHLLQAGVELLLALRTFLASFLESLEKETFTGKEHLEFLYKVHEFLDDFLKRMGKNQGEASALGLSTTLKFKLSALSSIREVLQKEWKEKPTKKSAKGNENERIRREVFSSIVKILEREMAKTQEELQALSNDPEEKFSDSPSKKKSRESTANSSEKTPLRNESKIS